MDTIWRNAAKKVRAREKQAASHITTTSTTAVANLPATAPTTAPPRTFFDCKTGTLEELEQTSHRLQRDWPKEDGIPFPAEILETLKALRVAVITRDAGRSTAITPVQTVQIASPESTQLAAETSSKKAEKKRRLREKRAAAKIPTSVGINGIPAPVPVTAQSRTEPIAITSTVYELDTAAPAPALADLWRKVARRAAKMGYHQEHYGTTLRTPALTVTATTPTVFDSTAPVATTPVPASVLVPVPTQTTTEPITAFESDTTAPAPISAPASTPTTHPSSTATTTFTAVEQHDTKQPNNRENEGRTEGGEDEMQQRREERREDSEDRENVEENRGEKEDKQESEDRNEDTGEEIRTQTGEDDTMRHQPTPFDWATEVDESFGPVPTFFDDHAPAEHVSCSPIAPANRADLLPPVSNQPAHLTTDNPTSAVGVNPVTDTSVGPELVVDEPILLVPTRTPRDLSGLRSGTQNPWSSMHRRRQYSHPSRDSSSLRSNTLNPWSSLRHRD
jgi:hypothetical protein